MDLGLDYGKTISKLHFQVPVCLFSREQPNLRDSLPGREHYIFSVIPWIGIHEDSSAVDFLF